jgi:hypothetical protein
MSSPSPSVLIKRNVLLRAVVTDQLRAELSAEIQNAVDEVDQRIETLDAQTRAYITDLQRTNLQQAMVVRKQVEAEKKRHQDLRDALMERRAQVEVLEDGGEVVRGTLESFVELKVGANLRDVLAGVSIVTKDDEVTDIRERSADEESADSLAALLESARSQEDHDH